MKHMQPDTRVVDVTCEECNTGFFVKFTDTDEGGMSLVACPFCSAELTEDDYIEVDEYGETDGDYKWGES